MATQQPSTESAEDRAIREIDAEDEDALAALKQQAGPPPDGRRQSESAEDDAWATEDPTVSGNHDMLAQQLTTQGLPPNLAQQLLLLKLHPEMAPVFGQPTQDAERADMLARLAQYPFRLSLLDTYDDPGEMARKAEQLDRRFQRNHTRRQDQAAAMRIVPGQGPAAQPYGALSPPSPPSPGG